MVKEQGRPLRIEPRWPAALAVIAVFFVLSQLSDRVRLIPFWTPYLIVVAPLLPMAGVRLSGADARWILIERVTVLAFSVVVEAMNIAILLYLIANMLGEPEGFSARQLFASSFGAWVANVFAFSMVYWQLDRGGPEARANGAAAKPDWLFPQTGVPEQAPGWKPAYVDYLFLAFSTATAFSPTDTMPLTVRAKLLMMVESAVSLAALVIVASRAINILGS